MSTVNFKMTPEQSRLVLAAMENEERRLKHLEHPTMLQLRAAHMLGMLVNILILTILEAE
jgi:hypothetical protein